MSLLPCPPALALLLRLKMRGLVRRQWRRLRTPKGFALTVLGCAAFGVWLASLAVSFAAPPAPLGGGAGELRVRAFALVLALLSLSSALTNRGLYLPKNEIERLFSAPVARADLVRYRLIAGGLRSLVGGLLLGLFGARRMPVPPLAFVGIMLAMQALPILNQLLAIALGGLERRAAAPLRRLGSLLLFGLLAGLGAIVFALSTDRPLETIPLVGPWLAGATAVEGDLLAHPVLARLTLPFVPWARMISAGSVAEFAPWFALCVLAHVLLFELCARLPIDFRELSLATSTRAAARLARLRRGGGVAATRASRAAARWRIPWVFGRGPAGAIAWRKSAGMVRKAKSALWVAMLALAFITVVAGVVIDGPEEGRTLFAPILIASLGTVYLCSGLRFDFREELERMDVIRAWPLAPAQVFRAMLVPEVALVSLLVGGTVLCESALSGVLAEPLLALDVGGIVACVPLAVFAWVALDNVVFLFAPVRVVPGQDGFVQNAGRRMIQMALLLVLAGLMTVLGSVGFACGLLFVSGVLAGPALAAHAAGFAALLAVLAAGDAALVWLGGVVLRRFDVASDRG